jgi:siderophore synthetase component
LFGLLFPLLIKYGIGFETHGQNTFLRVDCESKQIKGFAIRDHEGVKIHLPTLREQGIDLDIEASPGCTNDLLGVLSKVHHALVQNHIGNLLYNMNIDASEGWGIVRGAFDGVVKGDQSRDGRRVLEFMMGDMMLFKCFLGQRMSGAFNDVRKPRQLEPIY